MLSNLKKLREDCKLNQTELSKKANVSRSIIVGLESGKIKDTTIGTLKKLANALNTNVSNFFN